MRWLWTCLSLQLNIGAAWRSSGITWYLKGTAGNRGLEAPAEEVHTLGDLAEHRAGTQTWPCLILGSQGFWEAKFGRF